jgi:hypothetical protein
MLTTNAFLRLIGRPAGAPRPARRVLAPGRRGWPEVASGNDIWRGSMARPRSGVPQKK